MFKINYLSLYSCVFEFLGFSLVKYTLTHLLMLFIQGFCETYTKKSTCQSSELYEVCITHFQQSSMYSAIFKAWNP